MAISQDCGQAVRRSHASILVSVEKSRALPTATARSFDNLPNPMTNKSRPYLPVNAPAIGGLMDMFHSDLRSGPTLRAGAGMP